MDQNVTDLTGQIIIQKLNNTEYSRSHKHHNKHRIKHQEQKTQSNSPDDFQILFRDQRAKLQEYDETLGSLQIFKQHIDLGHQQGIFDEEEINWIDAENKRICELKIICETDLLQKEDLYTNSILKLEQLLEKRRIAIEEAEKEASVFTKCPHLLQQFAEKRAKLMKLVEKGKAELVNEK